MRIAYVAAGAGGMYCGSCIHDNTVAAALQRRGHEVALLPTYTPMRTDEASVSLPRVFYGAVNVYLQQKSALFRHTPRAFDRLLDRPALLRWVSRLASSTDAHDLGALTLSVLEGEHGPQSKELEKLADWLAGSFRPEVVHLTNSLFLGAARRIKERVGAPVAVAVQGEDLFIDALPEPWRGRVVAELRRRAADADVFIAPSRYYARHMAELLGVDASRFRVVQLGLRLEGYGVAERTPPESGAASRPGPGATVGYLARIAPEKGLHLLAEAFRLLAARPGNERLRLAAAGYLGARDRPYLESIRERIAAWGLEERFEYVGEVDLAGKIRFLGSIDVFSVPTTYREAKGISALEAMANGVPVVLPRHGSFPEMIEATGGGLLVEPDSPESLAEGIAALLGDAGRRAELGRRGREAVHRDFGDNAMAAATLAVYEEIAGGAGAGRAAGREVSRVAG